MDLVINEIKILDYLDGSSKENGYNPLPSKLRVNFTIGKCTDWITIKYFHPLHEEDLIVAEINRILNFD